MFDVQLLKSVLVRTYLLENKIYPKAKAGLFETSLDFITVWTNEQFCYVVKSVNLRFIPPPFPCLSHNF